GDVQQGPVTVAGKSRGGQGRVFDENLLQRLYIAARRAAMAAASSGASPYRCVAVRNCCMCTTCPIRPVVG
ncbi:MAG TPA: hypothetical protein VIJ00_13825, partial [Nakamurella sp.]